MQSVCLSIMRTCDQSHRDEAVILIIHLTRLIYHVIIIVVISDVDIVINVSPPPPASRTPAWQQTGSDAEQLTNNGRLSDLFLELREGHVSAIFSFSLLPAVHVLFD